jgi:hypothetical protein
MLYKCVIVSDAVCDYFQTGKLEFQVWGEAPPPVVVKEKRVRDPDDPDDVPTEEEIKEEKVPTSHASQVNNILMMP